MTVDASAAAATRLGCQRYQSNICNRGMGRQRTETPCATCSDQRPGRMGQGLGCRCMKSAMPGTVNATMPYSGAKIQALRDEAGARGAKAVDAPSQPCG